MRLVLAIIEPGDAGKVLHYLASEGFGATRLASSGGLLRQHSVTLLVGVEDAEVDRVIQIIASRCRSRAEVTGPSPRPPETSGLELASSRSMSTGGAIIFVLDMVQYAKF